MKETLYTYPSDRYVTRGITLRDEFARAALPSCINENMHGRGDWVYSDAALDAYKYADAMMRVREA